MITNFIKLLKAIHRFNTLVICWFSVLFALSLYLFAGATTVFLLTGLGITLASYWGVGMWVRYPILIFSIAITITFLIHHWQSEFPSTTVLRGGRMGRHMTGSSAEDEGQQNE